jgi:hypothetical protein
MFVMQLDGYCLCTSEAPLLRSMGSLSGGCSSEHEESTLQFAEPLVGFAKKFTKSGSGCKECVRKIGGRRELEIASTKSLGNLRESNQPQ